MRWKLHEQQLKEEAEKAKEDDETETMSPAMAMHCWLARMDAVEAILYRPAPAQEVAKTEPSSDGEICDLDGTDFEFFEHESYSRRAALATMLMDGEMDQQQHHIKIIKPTMSPELAAHEQRQRTFMQSISTRSKGPKVPTPSKAPKISTRSKGPKISARSKGPKISARFKGPKISVRSKGPKISTRSKGRKTWRKRFSKHSNTPTQSR